ncbi:MAG TPA: hypothetical protein VF591_21430 [Pyrinomonadaceae bacterium]
MSSPITLLSAADRSRSVADDLSAVNRKISRGACAGRDPLVAPPAAGWTSAGAAGLPIFPGLVRYDEVFGRREITHALRFTAARTRRAYVAPARHFASGNTDPNLPPMGMRVRLKASFDIAGYTPAMQVILRALKKYGMILADNGSNWYVSGAPDARWNDSELNTLKALKGSDFEVVKMGTVVTQ